MKLEQEMETRTCPYNQIPLRRVQASSPSQPTYHWSVTPTQGSSGDSTSEHSSVLGTDEPWSEGRNLSPSNCDLVQVPCPLQSLVISLGK